MILAKNLRISDTYHFNLVKKYGKSFHGDLLIISALKDLKGASNPTKFGIVITNKIDKRATERNRIKRLFHRCIREHFEVFPKGEFLVVVVAKPLIAKKTYEEISTDFNKALSKVFFA